MKQKKIIPGTNPASADISPERLLNLFIKLVKIPSPTYSEHKIISLLQKFFLKMGIKGRILKCGPSANLLFRVPGSEKSAPMLLCAHMDTVTPCRGVRPLISAGRVKTDGRTVLGGDDKIAVAMIMECVKTLKNRGINHPPLEILFTCAEETGLNGIKKFNFSLIKSKKAYIFDSSGKTGEIVMKSPYHKKIELSITGKAAHAGIEPEKGINAIQVISEIISSLRWGRIDNETSMNAGTISGGKATNIVADHASAKLEIRSFSYQKLLRHEHRLKTSAGKICAKYGAGLDYESILQYEGYTLKKNSEAVTAVIKAMKKTGIKPVFISSGGGSDANIIRRNGIDAVNLSCGMHNPHSVSEYANIDEMTSAARLLLSLIIS